MTFLLRFFLICYNEINLFLYKKAAIIISYGQIREFTSNKSTLIIVKLYYYECSLCWILKIRSFANAYKIYMEGILTWHSFD